jgi:hypothetical protein
MVAFEYSLQDEGPGGPVVCELRYIDSYRLRYLFADRFPSLLPLERAAGMVIYSPGGEAVGTPAMMLSSLWGEARLPYEVGVHRSVPLLCDGCYVAYGGETLPLHVLADISVSRRLYVEDEESGLAVLRRLAEAGLPLTPRMASRWLSPLVIRRSWRPIRDLEELGGEPAVYLPVLDVLS